MENIYTHAEQIKDGFSVVLMADDILHMFDSNKLIYNFEDSKYNIVTTDDGTTLKQPIVNEEKVTFFSELFKVGSNIEHPITFSYTQEGFIYEYNLDEQILSARINQLFIVDGFQRIVALWEARANNVDLSKLVFNILFVLKRER